PWLWMERALKCPSPSPRMEKVPVKRPPQLRSRRVWSRKWLIRYFRKRSYFSSWLCTCSQACARFPPSRKKVCPCEGHMQVGERLVLWGADTVEFYLNFLLT